MASLFLQPRSALAGGVVFSASHLVKERNNNLDEMFPVAVIMTYGGAFVAAARR